MGKIFWGLVECINIGAPWQKLRVAHSTKDNRHHVCAEHRPNEIGDKVLAHVGLKHQDKLVESAIRIVTFCSKKDNWSL